MMNNIIDFDPEHQPYLTIQSKQLAMKAKAFMHISWCPKSDSDHRGCDRYEADGDSSLSHKSKSPIFPCFSFLHHRHRHLPHTLQLNSLPVVEHNYELIGQSLILNEHHVRRLGPELPNRVMACPWTLKFCTSLDGFSLHSLYRKLSKCDSSPVLIVIEDLEKHVFGALSSCNPHVSDHFYGTSDCYLFTFQPEFHIYKWDGDNFYFIRGNETELCFGCGDGKAGLWLDSDLNKGFTEPCSTYGSAPLLPTKDFIIKNLECWSFV